MGSTPSRHAVLARVTRCRTTAAVEGLAISRLKSVSDAGESVENELPSSGHVPERTRLDSVQEGIALDVQMKRNETVNSKSQGSATTADDTLSASPPRGLESRGRSLVEPNSLI